MHNDLAIKGLKRGVRRMLKKNAPGNVYKNFMLINQVGFHFVFEEFASDAIIFSAQSFQDPRYLEMIDSAYKNLRTDYILVSITKDPIHDIKQFVEENPQYESIQFSNLDNVYPKEKLFSLLMTKNHEELLNGIMVINKDKIVENIRLSTDPNNYKLILEIFPFLYDND